MKHGGEGGRRDSNDTVHASTAALHTASRCCQNANVWKRKKKDSHTWCLIDSNQVFISKQHTELQYNTYCVTSVNQPWLPLIVISGFIVDSSHCSFTLQ